MVSFLFNLIYFSDFPFIILIFSICTFGSFCSDMIYSDVQAADTLQCPAKICQSTKPWYATTHRAAGGFKGNFTGAVSLTGGSPTWHRCSVYDKDPEREICITRGIWDCEYHEYSSTSGLLVWPSLPEQHSSLSPSFCLQFLNIIIYFIVLSYVCLILSIRSLFVSNIFKHSHILFRVIQI